MTTSVDITAALNRMSEELTHQLSREPAMIGIHTGGVWVAERLHKSLKLAEPLGTLDISFYRDDFTRIGLNPQVKASHLPVNIDGRHVILVDDVLHTGRTIRAAMNEIFDYGRPASVILAVLLDRNDRELPVQADVVGEQLSLKKDEHVKLCGPEKLTLTIQEVSG